MNVMREKETAPDLVEFTLNGRAVTAPPEETILQTAKRLGIEIPHLCYMDGMRPDGNCRACMVEIKGERVLAPSCCRAPKAGMEVTSAACGVGAAGVDAATTGSASWLDPREWGSRRVSAGTPAAEKTVTEMAAAVSTE